MTTTTTRRPAEAQTEDLPALTAADRIALAIGAHLILRAEQHRGQRAARAARAEQARVAGAATQAARANDSTFAHRALAGPRW